MVDRTNPCSITDLRTVIGAAGLEVFDRFYVYFFVLRDTWLASCRPDLG